MRRQVGRVIGRELISPVVEGMDVDAIVHQIDIQDLLENQLDINEVLERVDVNKILDRVDLNRQLERVDMDKLMSNIDINALIERSDLEAIITRSSSGVFGSFLNLFRARMAMGDQRIQRIFRCACCSEEPWLPPRPGIDQYKTKIPWPETSQQFGVAVQFRCCGFFTRTFAWLTDNLIIGFSYMLIVWLLDRLISLFDNYSTFYAGVGDRIKPVGDEINDVPTFATDPPLSETDYNSSSGGGTWSGWIFGPTLLIYDYCYSTVFIACFGRTIGMLVFGLLVVNHDGRHVGFCQTMLRNLVGIFNAVFFGWLVGLIRRDGKNFTDLMSCTCLVYAWNSKAAVDLEKNKGNNEFATSIKYDEEEYALLFNSLKNNNSNENNHNAKDNANRNINRNVETAGSSKSNFSDNIYVDAEENYEGYVAKQL